MSNINMRIALSLVLAATVTGCGGGGDDAAVTCQAMGGAAPSSTANCLNCTVDDDGLASDGNFNSAAVMTEPAGSAGTVAVRATAGSLFSAGTPAGAIFSSAESHTQSSPVWTITTYNGGVLQETSTVDSDGTGSPARPIEHVSMTTTLPFDAVEFSFARSSGTQVETVRVYELCTN